MEMDHYYYYSDFDKIFRCMRVKNNVRAARERATVRDSEQLKSRFHSLQYETRSTPTPTKPASARDRSIHQRPISGRSSYFRD